MNHFTTDGKGMCPHAFDAILRTCFCFDDFSCYEDGCCEAQFTAQTPAHSCPSGILGSSLIICYGI